MSAPGDARGVLDLRDDGDERPLPILEADDAPLAEASRPRRRALLGMAALAATISFLFLGGFGLWDPWETHYGEVTRNMIESHDWVAPRWGYEGRPVGDPPAEKGPFLSKPILIFWTEAIAIRTFGYAEWSFRLPMALLATLVVFGAFLMVRRVTGDGRAAFWASLVVATCPQFYLISRQSQTDMPFVGNMTLGLLFFLMAVFRPRERISDRRFFAQVAGTAGFLALVIVPQLFIVATDVRLTPGANLPAVRKALLSMWMDGRWHAAVFGTLAAVAIASLVLPPLLARRRHRAGAAGATFDNAYKDRWVRQLHLAIFYAFIGLATLAKGLLGFLLPGAIIFFFMLVTWSWPLLRRVQLLRGTAVFIAVAFPWYVAMFVVHGKRFYQRFFVHDHFNRFASGVHQVDTGMFEHFIKWLGIGMFPWAAVVPMVLIPLLALRGRPRARRAAFVVFLFVWSFFAWFLFTRSSTKFHHYIFPALPPLAMLVGLWMRDLLRLSPRALRLAALCALGFGLSIGWTIHDDQQALRNLMTYKYDRPLPEHLPTDPDAPVADTVETTWAESRFAQETPAPILAALFSPIGEHQIAIRGVWWLALAAFGVWLLLAGPLGARLGRGMLGVAAFSLALWTLNVYMPKLAPAWSQKYIFDEYFARCTPLPNPDDIDDVYTPLVRRAGLGFIADAIGARGKQVCEEDIIAWLFTWRGETFYGNNEILPVAKTAHMKDYLVDFNAGKTFYAVLETHRLASFKSALNRESEALAKDGTKPYDGIGKWQVDILHAESPYFMLVQAVPSPRAPEPPAPAKPAPAAEPAAPATPAGEKGSEG